MITKRDDATRGLTREELLAPRAAVDLETANRALSLSRTTGYDLAKRGRYPCTVLRLGNAYRIVTADLLKLLHIDVREPAGVDEPTAVTPEAEGGRRSSTCCFVAVGAAVLVGVRRVGGTTTDDGDRARMWDLDKLCDHDGATEVVGRFIAMPKGRGAQGERGRLWTVQHDVRAAGP